MNIYLVVIVIFHCCHIKREKKNVTVNTKIWLFPCGSIKLVPDTKAAWNLPGMFLEFVCIYRLYVRTSGTYSGPQFSKPISLESTWPYAVLKRSNTLRGVSVFCWFNSTFLGEPVLKRLACSHRQEVVKLVIENKKRNTKFLPRLKSFSSFAKIVKRVFLPLLPV